MHTLRLGIEKLALREEVTVELMSVNVDKPDDLNRWCY